MLKVEDALSHCQQQVHYRSINTRDSWYHSAELKTTVLIAEKLDVFGPILNFNVFCIIVHVFIPEAQVHSPSDQ